MALPLTAWIAREMQLIAVLGSPLLGPGRLERLSDATEHHATRIAAAEAIRSPGCPCWSPLAHGRPGRYVWYARWAPWGRLY